MPSPRYLLPPGRCNAAWDTLRARIEQNDALREFGCILRFPDDTDWDNPPSKGVPVVRFVPQLTGEQIVGTKGPGRPIYERTITVDVEVSVADDEWQNTAGLWFAVGRNLTGDPDGDRAAAFRWWDDRRIGGIDELDLVQGADWQHPGQILITCREDG